MKKGRHIGRLYMRCTEDEKAKLKSSKDAWLER